MKHAMRLFSIVVVGAVTWGVSVGWAQPAPTDQPGQPPAQQPQERDPGIGIQPADRDVDRHQITEGQANSIRATLADATDGAMTRGNFSDLAARLTTPDEQRFEDFVRRDMPQLDAMIDRLNEAWQARYNESFSVRDREAAYPPAIVRIQAGLTEEALAQRERDEQRAAEAGARIEGQVGEDVGLRVEAQPAEPRPAAPSDQSNLATVIFPATGELPEVHVPLVNEGGLITDNWRIDIPLHIDGQTVHDNLYRSINKALQQQEQWPADVNEGYRKATHIVMLALFDVDREAMPAAHRDMEHEPQPDPMQPDRPDQPGVQPGEPRPGEPQPEPGHQPGEPR